MVIEINDGFSTTSEYTPSHPPWVRNCSIIKSIANLKISFSDKRGIYYRNFILVLQGETETLILIVYQRIIRNLKGTVRSTTVRLHGSVIQSTKESTSPLSRMSRAYVKKSYYPLLEPNLMKFGPSSSLICFNTHTHGHTHVYTKSK